jgi:hypothetical protein
MPRGSPLQEFAGYKTQTSKGNRLPRPQTAGLALTRVVTASTKGGNLKQIASMFRPTPETGRGLPCRRSASRSGLCAMPSQAAAAVRLRLQTLRVGQRSACKSIDPWPPTSANTLKIVRGDGPGQTGQPSGIEPAHGSTGKVDRFVQVLFGGFLEAFLVKAMFEFRPSGSATLFVLLAATAGTRIVSTKFGCLQSYGLSP